MDQDASQLGKGFANPAYALKVRDTFRKIAEQQIGEQIGQAQVGRVMTVNLGKLKATVWLPGDPEPIEVRMFSGSIPNDVGDERNFTGTATPNSKVGPGALVVVETVRGQPYMTQILSGGQFAYDLSYAGMKSKIFNATHIPALASDSGLTVQGSMTSAFSFFISGLNLAPEAVMVGPFVSIGSWGASLDGLVRIMVTQLEESRTYEFAVNQYNLYTTTAGVVTPSWMRLMPVKSSHQQGIEDLEVLLDIGVRPTTYRDSNGKELWLRFSAAIAGDILDYTWVHVESFGPILAFGDPKTGKIVAEDVASPAPISGYLGFHDANHGQLKREDALPGGAGDSLGFDFGRYPEVGWSTGPYMDSSTRTAELIAPQLGMTGPMLCDTVGVGWTGSIIAAGIGPSRHGLYEGQLNITMPADGTKIAVYPASNLGTPLTDQAVTVASGRIPLAAGQTLYFALPPSIGNGSHAGFTNWMSQSKMFFVVDSSTYYAEEHDYKLPQWALPIIRRGTALELVGYRAFSSGIQRAMHDGTQYYSSSVTTASVGISTTETGLFTLPTFNFKKECAYRWKLRCHYQTSAAVTNSVTFRIRKGTTAAGAEWVFFGQYGLNALNLPFGMNGEGYIVNQSGADISTQTIVTAVATPVSGFTLVANSTSQKRWIELEYCGPASKYSSQGMAIT